jgi:hypothetical protein
MNKYMLQPPPPHPMPIVLRCYGDSGNFPLRPRRNFELKPSRWTLIFDTETTTTPEPHPPSLRLSKRSAELGSI